MVAEIPIFVLPFFLVGTDFVGRSPTVVGPLAIAFMLLFHFGDLTNCLADRELDAVYKPHLSEAVRALGPRNVACQIVVTAALALLLTLYVSITVGRAAPFLLTAMGLVMGSQYSFRPLWLKGRGLWQVATLCAVIFVGPMLLVGATVGGDLDVGAVVFALAYAAMQQGIILVNTAEDLPEDTGAGIRTAAVAIGLLPALTLACAMTGIGGAVIAGYFLVTSHRAGVAPTWWLAGFVAAWGFSVWSIAKSVRAVRAVPVADRITVLRRESWLVPVWIALTAWATLACAVASA